MININLPQVAKVYFVVFRKKFWKDKNYQRSGFWNIHCTWESSRRPYVVRACI